MIILTEDISKGYEKFDFFYWDSNFISQSFDPCQNEKVPSFGDFVKVLTDCLLTRMKHSTSVSTVEEF